MNADDLTPHALKLRDIVLERLGMDGANMLATLVDIADGNLERFAVLLVNGFDENAANEALRAAGYLNVGRFQMCARAACSTVIAPKSFVIARGTKIFCSTACDSLARRDVKELAH